MNTTETDSPGILARDEAIIFIAGRYHISPDELATQLLAEKFSLPLLKNEINILIGIKSLLPAERPANSNESPIIS